MNFLKTLANAIKKRSLGVELTSVEQAVYEQAYCDCLGKNNSDFDRDEEVYNYYCDMFESMIRRKDMIPFMVFNALLHYMGTRVSLVEFCKFCGLDTNDLEIRKSVIDSINDWCCEEDDKYEYNEEVCCNPLIVIATLEKVKFDNIEILSKLKFAIINGISIGNKCINEDGSIDEDKLYDSLVSYIDFKNQFLNDMKENNTKLDGVVLMGDIFDIFSNVYALANTNQRKINALVKKLNVFGRKNEDALSLGLPFVGIVSGHNDTWFGESIKDAVKVFGSDVMYLGKFAPCTIEKNDYWYFANYLYFVYKDFSVGNRSKEGNLCYFIPPEKSEELKVKSGNYEVTICDLVVDGIKMVDYKTDTVEYSSDCLDKAKIKFKKQVG